MKRTSLTTAVIAGIAGVAGISNMASAVYLNSDGLGQVLIYPYYTVNGGNSTAITVVNTTGDGKAVKVRFLEAYDSREVLDFNLYLSPHDVWVAQVIPTGAGGAAVFTNDNSCTVPALGKTAAAAQPFSTAAFDGRVTANDGGPTSLSRTLEGYVELIEMGTVTNVDDDSLDAITHSAGVPASCGQVVKAWSGGYWSASAGVADIAAPSGGLFGGGTIINNALGTIEGYNADAIDQFYDPASLIAPNHSSPGVLTPNIASGSSATSYVFAPSPTTTTPTLVTTTYTQSIDAVSSLFMADALYNEYWTNGGTAANSEWVVTFPTKRFYVDPSLVVAAASPFEVLFSADDGSPTADVVGSYAQVDLAYYGREEETATGGVNFSPSVSPQPALPYEAQVVTFNQTGTSSAVLGSNLIFNIPTGYINGWATFDLFDASPLHILPASRTVGSNHVFEGLPVTGFWVAQLVNGAVGGVLANYTSLYRHKFHRVCSAGGGICS